MHQERIKVFDNDDAGYEEWGTEFAYRKPSQTSLLCSRAQDPDTNVPRGRGRSTPQLANRWPHV
jgi:hypothetical protein